MSSHLLHRSPPLVQPHAFYSCSWRLPLLEEPTCRMEEAEGVVQVVSLIGIELAHGMINLQDGEILLE
jgi:hypothetical protein